MVQGFLTGFNTSSHTVRNLAGTFFSRQGWIHFMIFFETLVADSFAYFFVVGFYSFSTKFMYNANRTSPNGLK